jgi:hypothetical protein
MLWGTVFLILFSWAIPLGWIVMKIGRSIKGNHVSFHYETGLIAGILRFLERKTVWLERLDDGPSDFAESPLIGGMAFTIMGILSIIPVVVMSATALLALALIGVGAWNITTVAEYAFIGICWSGWFFFHGFSYIGLALSEITRGVIWFFTNAEFWIMIGTWVLFLLKWCAIAFVSCMAMGLTFYGVSKIPAVRRLARSVADIFDPEKQVERVRARNANREQRPERTWTCGYCKYNGNPLNRLWCVECQTERPPPKINWVLRALSSTARFCCWPFISAKDIYVRVKNKQFFVLGGGWSVFIEYLWAIKQGVCPTVHFIDPAALQASAQASAQQRMEKENRKSCPDDTSLGLDLIDEIRREDV